MLHKSIAIFASFVITALAITSFTRSDPANSEVVLRLPEPLEIDSRSNGYVDSVKGFEIGERDFLVITFWIRWNHPPPKFVWTATGSAELTISTYERSDLAFMGDAVAVTVTASSHTKSANNRLCLGLQTATNTYFVDGFENCWSFD